MKDWQERVVQEHKDLMDKMDRLDEFMVARGTSIGEDNLSLLQAQYTAMNAYRSALEARIATFED